MTAFISIRLQASKLGRITTQLLSFGLYNFGVTYIRTRSQSMSCCLTKSHTVSFVFVALVPFIPFLITAASMTGMLNRSNRGFEKLPILSRCLLSNNFHFHLKFFLRNLGRNAITITFSAENLKNLILNIGINININISTNDYTR